MVVPILKGINKLILSFDYDQKIKGSYIYFGLYGYSIRNYVAIMVQDYLNMIIFESVQTFYVFSISININITSCECCIDSPLLHSDDSVGLGSLQSLSTMTIVVETCPSQRGSRALLC